MPDVETPKEHPTQPHRMGLVIKYVRRVLRVLFLTAAAGGGGLFVFWLVGL